MRLDASPRQKNAPRPAEKSATGFKQWVRGRNCLAVGTGNCYGKVQAAHVDYAGDKGIGTKCSDRFTVPLCAGHHALQHNHGWRWFETRILGKIGAALEAANFLWSRWPGRAAWERKLER